MSGTGLRVGRRGTPVSGSAYGALLLTIGQCTEFLRPRDIRCRAGAATEKGKAASARSQRLCFILNLPQSPDLRANSKPPPPPSKLAHSTEPFGMMEEVRGLVCWSLDPLLSASASSCCMDRGYPLFSAPANSRTSFAPRSPLRMGRGTCQAGWRRALHSSQGSLPETASGRASHTDYPSGQAWR